MSSQAIDREERAREAISKFQRGLDAILMQFIQARVNYVIDTINIENGLNSDGSVFYNTSVTYKERESVDG